LKIWRFRGGSATLIVATLVVVQPVVALGPVPSGWEYAQELAVPGTGLVEVRLPLATLDKAGRGLEDVRILDGLGADVPFAFSAKAPSRPRTTAAASEISQVAGEDSTVGVYRTAALGPLDTVTLRTPARDFIKPVTVEASDDRAHWRALAVRYPIFRLADGSERLDVRVAPGSYPYLRITVGDARERPIPIAGVTTSQSPQESAALVDVLSVTPESMSSAAGATRILLNLPARHLSLRRVTLDPDDPVFSREVSVAVRTSVEGEVREQVIARGRVHRVDLAGAERTEVLSIPIPSQTLDGRSLVVVIENADSPPLSLRRPVAVAVEPVRLRFLSRPAQRYVLAVGNRSAKPPRYDLSAIPSVSQLPVVGSATPGVLERNPGYQPEEAAKGAPAAGGALDASRWRRSRQVIVQNGGVLALEVPPDVLSRSPGLADLRILADGRQIPYILERGLLVRRVAVPLEALPPERGGTVSRWRLRLPDPGLPLDDLACAVPDGVFRRSVGVYEDASPERGGRTLLAGTVWERRTQGAGGNCGVALRGRTATASLLLEIDDGDNPPLALGACTVSWRTSRLLFKNPHARDVALLSENPGAGPPRYDLDLLADEILAADATPGSLAADDRRERAAGVLLPAGWRTYAFWGALVLVVAVLIGVIAKLLPPPPGAG